MVKLRRMKEPSEIKPVMMPAPKKESKEVPEIELKTSIRTYKQGTAAMKGKMAGFSRSMAGKIGAFNGKVNGFRGEIGGFKGEMKQAVSRVHASVAYFRNEIGKRKDEFQAHGRAFRG